MEIFLHTSSSPLFKKVNAYLFLYLVDGKYGFLDLILGKISAQPHTLIMYAAISYYHYTQTAIMKRTSQSENCMHNYVWGCAEILPNSLPRKPFSAPKPGRSFLAHGWDANESCMPSRSGRKGQNFDAA